MAKSTIEEMYDILHPPEEEVVVAACRECTLILEETTKYCPECGVVTELGRATEALGRIGDEEKKDGPFATFVTIGQDSMPGGNSPESTTVWDGISTTITAGDPLNQWAKEEETSTWEEYINGRKLSA